MPSLIPVVNSSSLNDVASVGALSEIWWLIEGLYLVLDEVGIEHVIKVNVEPGRWSKHSSFWDPLFCFLKVGWKPHRYESLHKTDSSVFTDLKIVVVELISRVWLFVTPWTVACQASLSFTISQSLLRFNSIESVILCKPSHPLLPPSPFAFSLSQYQGLLQWVSSSSQVAKVLELQLSQQFFQWIFRIDFL